MLYNIQIIIERSVRADAAVCICACAHIRRDGVYGDGDADWITALMEKGTAARES